MKQIKSLFYVLFLVSIGLLLNLSACKKKAEPNIYKGVWVPGIVQQEGTTQNLADLGLPYATFQITFDGGASNGTYNVVGAAPPFPANFEGTWTRTGKTISLSDAPQGFNILQDVNVANNMLNFVVDLESGKIGSIKLNFALVKRR